MLIMFDRDNRTISAGTAEGRDAAPGEGQSCRGPRHLHARRRWYDTTHRYSLPSEENLQLARAALCVG
jgi:hypothetical protein